MAEQAPPIERSDEELQELRDRLYPNWWMCVPENPADARNIPPDHQPHYQVYCNTPEELELAYQLRPDGVQAEMVRCF